MGMLRLGKPAIAFKIKVETLKQSCVLENTLTRTSRNQKGKVAQGVACQRQEKRDKREAFPTATFPRAYCSRMWLDCSTDLEELELSHGRTAF